MLELNDTQKSDTQLNNIQQKDIQPNNTKKNHTYHNDTQQNDSQHNARKCFFIECCDAGLNSTVMVNCTIYFFDFYVIGFAMHMLRDVTRNPHFSHTCSVC